jgi:hypothetical protein
MNDAEPKIHYDTVFNDRLVARYRKKLLGKGREDSRIERAIKMLQGEFDMRALSSIMLAFSLEAIEKDDRFDVWQYCQAIALLRVLISDEHLIAMQAKLLFGAARWVTSGKRIYEVTDGLAERLRHTELRGLRSVDVQMPYRTFYIDVPEATGLHVPNPETGMHRLRGVYVSDDTIADGRRSIHMIAIGHWTRISGDIYDDAATHLVLRLDPEQSIDDSMAESMADPVNIRDVELANNCNFWKQTLPWIMNVIFYTTSNQARLELHGIDPDEAARERRKARLLPRRKRDRIEQELRQREREHRIIVGAGIPGLDSGSEQTGTGRTISKRFLRMGHWRNQACGPGRVDRRQTWIEPHWVGPEAGELVESVHVVK